MEQFDIVIVGAGIAGAGLAWALAPRRRVLLLEAERVAGYHTTGRSAAFFAETYGGPLVQPLTCASKPFFENPPTGFTDVPLIRPRGALYTVTVGQEASADKMLAELAAVEGLVSLSAEEAARRMPLLDPARLTSAIYDPTCGALDVAALHQGYLKGARKAGAEIRCNAPVEKAVYDGRWHVRAGGREVRADVMVNAAGAWGDAVARLAGVAPIGLVPKRRTLITADIDVPVPQDGPLTIDIDENWYFKTEGDEVLISPADATPTEAQDVQPEEMDVATAAARFEAATGRSIRRITHKWAGLRTFAADGAPVIGFDAHSPGFFWSVGQGGWGIQTSPAWSQLAANLLLTAGKASSVGKVAVDPDVFSPARFAVPA